MTVDNLTTKHLKNQQTFVKRVRGLSSKTDQVRFWEKVDKSGECWLWMAATVNGYGKFIFSNGISCRAHRYAYEVANGPVASGLDLHHTCNNRACVNPDHLIPVPHEDHSLLFHSAPKIDLPHRQRVTHCSQGHPLEAENLFLHASSIEGRFIARCLTCHSQGLTGKRGAK